MPTSLGYAFAATATVTVVCSGVFEDINVLNKTDNSIFMTQPFWFDKIRIITINQLIEDLQDTCEIIMEFSNNKELYVSIDIDVIDPGFAPATGYKEPGGLTSRQFIYLIQRINKIKNLRAIDIVEINPEKDIDGMTVKLGAKILGELI